MTNFELLKQRDDEYIIHSYGRFPIAIDKGKNATCYDLDGKKYIDFTSGIGVNSLGFCDDGWVSAVCSQLNKLQHISNLYYTSPCVEVAELLVKMTGMKNVFFSNSGAESNEGAIKAARKYSFTKYGENRNRIITLKNSFHGRTVTTLAATGQDVFHNYFFPFTEGFVFAEANNIEDVKSKLDSSVCAVVVELIQGEGGVLPLDSAFVSELTELCSEKDVLLIADEVQTGVGRTGTLYAYQQFGITPDIVTSAKGLGGGLPFGCILFGEKTQDVFGPGDHATTFGGNPICSAGAKEVLSRLTPEFLGEVKEKGEYISEKLLKMPHVKGIAGMGLMLGIELSGIEAPEVVRAGLKHGVLLLTAKQKLRLLPPLTITYKEIDSGLKALEKTLSEF
ncbi:MAG: aspartate aminotransferase family protein [Clostridiales bacterium]|nr:aspartate aminotransferase family protein [Clostridiales bacterium]